MPRRLLLLGGVLLLAVTSCGTSEPDQSEPADPTPATVNAWDSVVHVGSETSIALGVAISDDGHIATTALPTTAPAATDVDDADVTVTFADGTTRSATVVGTNYAHRISVVKVDGAPVRRAPFGDSTSVGAGDPVQLLGGDLATGPEVTEATVAVPATGVAGLGLIEVTVAGPLASPGSVAVAADGSIVGLFPSIRATSAGDTGTVQLMPVETALQIVENAITGVTPYLGISMLTGSAGDVLVERVAADSPAARAGLRPGDVLIGVADVSLRSAEDLAAVVAASTVGDDLLIRYVRDGTEQEATVTVAAAPPAGAGSG